VPPSVNTRIVLVLGLVMVALGVAVVVRLIRGDAPLTTSTFLDGVFAAFFILRGALNVHAARRASRPRATYDDSSTGGAP
jgi:hypothetical protein